MTTSIAPDHTRGHRATSGGLSGEFRGYIARSCAAATPARCPPFAA